MLLFIMFWSSVFLKFTHFVFLYDVSVFNTALRFVHVLIVAVAGLWSDCSARTDVG